MAAAFGGYAAETSPSAPALSAWLSRARISDYTAALMEEAVADLLGLEAGEGTPVAPLSYLHDFGERPASACLRADPVHLRADTTGLILFDAASFEIEEDESRALVDALTGYLARDGWRLVQGRRDRWYLLGESEQDLATAALPAQRGLTLAATPLGGADAAAWMARLNEIQMLLHAHPVNRARVARGQVAINSVWFWGGGTVRAGNNPCYTRVVADNACALGAARWRELATTSPPQQAGQFLDGLRQGEHALVTLESCRDAAAYEDFGAWQAAVQELEANWFAPLVTALKAGRVDRLELLPLNGRRYCLEKRSLQRFWKKVRDYRGATAFRQPSATRV